MHLKITVSFTCHYINGIPGTSSISANTAFYLSELVNGTFLQQLSIVEHSYMKQCLEGVLVPAIHMLWEALRSA